jgi:hypothetical protein
VRVWPVPLVAVAILVAALALAACGDNGDNGDNGGSEAPVAQGGKPTGEVTISN